MKEILKEPIYPYVKSQQEIDYEKKVTKLTNAQFSFKRMRLTSFKNALHGRHRSKDLKKTSSIEMEVEEGINPKDSKGTDEEDARSDFN